MTLAEFLLARINEDWLTARRTLVDEAIGGHAWNPSRIFADCEAKRRVVDLHKDAGMGDCAYSSDPCPTLRALALSYADHPDYLEEWRP